MLKWNLVVYTISFHILQYILVHDRCNPLVRNKQQPPVDSQISKPAHRNRKTLFFFFLIFRQQKVKGRAKIKRRSRGAQETVASWCGGGGEPGTWPGVPCQLFAIAKERFLGTQHARGVHHTPTCPGLASYIYMGQQTSSVPGCHHRGLGHQFTLFRK